MRARPVEWPECLVGPSQGFRNREIPMKTLQIHSLRLVWIRVLSRQELESSITLDRRADRGSMGPEISSEKLVPKPFF
ncbi:hypothetical protein CYMTET_54884 [Cymbomonas tetramitiformis]|uniref:Uncharacterized protein n=1 Tax=Cymbomonas tetramitiformis TaxID=36881 RepID=A0AAE0ENA7_9CHLO|nr:hypothetical protein CYMTET_54884 [Cymbomonas tetramitiformis]